MQENGTKFMNSSFRKKVMGCWLGKSVGGTLGMPFEGDNGPFDVTFYDPVPTEMIANDDLDLQVVWACVMDKMQEPRVDRNVLGQAWLDHVEFPMDEYGVAIRNLRLGLKPPLTGSYDNIFMNGMGAAIRSDIWACLAPGNPALAAKYAYEDACVDHAEEGIWAIVFLAALESIAFIESDSDQLLDLALDQLPETSLIRQAVTDTRNWWGLLRDWRVVREKILEGYGHENFSDVTMNMAFIVLGLLAAAGDFSTAICIATNCGKDTDSTAATLGSIMGIINPDGIDEKWLNPIGNRLVLSPEIVGINAPDTLEAFTDLILDLKDRLAGQAPEIAPVAPQTTAPFHIPVDVAFIGREVLEESKNTGHLQFSEDFYSMELPGAVAGLNTHDFKDEVLLLRYRLMLSEERAVRLIFNSHHENAVWIDGTYKFSRKAGSMVPAPHRSKSLKNQHEDITLEAGQHEILAAVCRPIDSDRADWVAIAADCKTKQWIPDAFIR